MYSINNTMINFEKKIYIYITVTSKWFGFAQYMLPQQLKYLYIKKKKKKKIFK